MTNDTATNEASSATLSKHFNAALTNAGTATKAGISNIALVHKARLSQQTRYANQLQQEYGAGDAGTKAAVAKAAATKLTVARVTAVYKRTATTAPAVTAPGWALYGHVYNASAQPLARLTIFFVDANRAFQRQPGFTYTDASGYYLLQSSSAPEAAVPLYIEIANAEGQPIYVDSTSRSPVSGQAVYGDITLASQTPIGDPPAPVRATGFPPTSTDRSDPSQSAPEQSGPDQSEPAQS